MGPPGEAIEPVQSESVLAFRFVTVFGLTLAFVAVFVFTAVLDFFGATFAVVFGVALACFVFGAALACFVFGVTFASGLDEKAARQK